ncbi:hypothetical protein STW0522RAO56_46340 [Raoultella planticola]|nr:hypothetical protein STW0522RAO56_46340 [Raoultella planticola]
MFREVNLISLLFLFPSDLSSSPRQSFTHRTMADMLPTTLYSSSFESLMRWLRLPALVTLWPVLPVNHLHAAFLLSGIRRV